MNSSNQKKIAAHKAANFIESGMVVGLGTGSTTQYAIEEIKKRVNNGSLTNLRCIPSSKQTEKFAKELGLSLISFGDSLMEIDISIDGADEVDPDLNLIKGGGGALLREKVLAQASKRNIIVVSENKLSKELGTNRPLPVEVLPFAWKVEFVFLKTIFSGVELRRSDSGEIFTTDQMNYILDCEFGATWNLDELNQELNSRAGIMEHGLFIGTTTDLIVGKTGGTDHIFKESLS